MFIQNQKKEKIAKCKWDVLIIEALNMVYQKMLDKNSASLCTSHQISSASEKIFWTILWRRKTNPV